MTSNRQIKLGVILSYASIFLNIAAGLIYTPWMVQQIGQSDYGLYTLANSLITLFLVDFGLSSATSKYITQYLAEDNQEKVNNFLGAIYKLYLAIDAVIFLALLVVYFLIDTIYVNLTPAEIEKFKVVYGISATFAVINFPFVTFNGILNSYEKFIQLKLADVIYRILFVLITVIALAKGYGLYALVAIHAIVGLLIILYKFIVIKCATPVKVNLRYSDRKLYQLIFTFSAWVTVATLAQRLIFNITPSILGITANSAAIAVFGVVTTIEGYSYTITNAINGMFMPRISRIYTGENADGQLNTLLINVGKFQFALNGLIVAGFAAIGRQFIFLWMGTEYLEAYYGILLVLIPGLFYNSLQIAETALVVKDKVKYSAVVTLCMGLINVVLSFALSSYIGVIGACISIFAAYTIRAVAMNIIYYKTLRVDIPRFVRKCYCRMSIPVVGTIVFGIGLNYLLEDSGWAMLVLKGILLIIVYLALVFLIGLEKEERIKAMKIFRLKSRETED